MSSSHHHHSSDVAMMDESMGSSSSSLAHEDLLDDAASIASELPGGAGAPRSPSAAPHSNVQTHRVYLANSNGNLAVLDVPVSTAAQALEPAIKPNKVHDAGAPAGEAAGEQPPSCRTVIVVDKEGTVLQNKSFRDSSSVGDDAVQKIAEGWLAVQGAASCWVIALARKNASIDVLRPLPQAPPTDGAEVGKETRAELVCTLAEPRMRAGIERWTGLAVGSAGIFACTSSGYFSFHPISHTEDAFHIGQPKLLSLPAPLQHVAFSPVSNPTHFAYGGEEIPLSVWDIAVALSSPPVSSSSGTGALSEANGSQAAESGASQEAQADATLNSKARKRKRQAETKSAARELMWGEIWRAKNLPNDALSLPQRANITSVSFLSVPTPSALPSVLTGTRDGYVRQYDLSSSTRRHVRQSRPFPPSTGNGGDDASQTAIKTLVVDPAHPDVVYVGTAAGRIGILDRPTGALAGSFKDIRAAVTGVLPLPIMAEEEEDARPAPLMLLSTTQDHLVRMHTATAPVPASAIGGGTSASRALTSRTRTRFESFVGLGNVVGAVWDGAALVGARKEAPTAAEDEEDEEASVWDGMKAVGGAGKLRRGRSAHKEAGSVEAEDEEEVRETSGKRRR